jgi:DNA repair protein RadA
MEISRATSLSLDEATSVYNWAYSKLASSTTLNTGVESAYRFLKKKQIQHKISTGSKALNDMLKGGIETSAVTEFFGPSGSGKTQLCFTLAVNVQQQISDGGLNGDAIYIDTEHKFSAERISQIASSLGLDNNDVLENIQLIRPFDSSQQERSLHLIISLLEKSNKEKLILVDSIISHYRSEFSGRDSLPERQHRIYKTMRVLANIAEIYDVAVVVTNQIQTLPDYWSGHREVSTGGNVIAHASTYRIQLSKTGYYGTAKIINSPCHSPAESRFMIKERGICDCED